MKKQKLYECTHTYNFGKKEIRVVVWIRPKKREWKWTVKRMEEAEKLLEGFEKLAEKL